MAIVNNQCYNPRTRQWGPCDQYGFLPAKSLPVIGGGGPPASCCIPDACCFDCERILSFLQCLRYAYQQLNGLQSAGSPDANFPSSVAKLDFLLQLYPCPQNWSIVDLGGGAYTIRDENGILGCITNLTLTNVLEILSDLSTPGQTRASCIQFEMDAECGSVLGICYNILVTDVGIPGSLYYEYQNFRLCTNADTLTNIINCNQCN